MQFKILKEYPGVCHAVTQRQPSMPFSNSMALHTGENTNAILSNRKLMMDYLDGLKKLSTTNQTHSTDVHVVDGGTVRWDTSSTKLEADAQITNLKGVALGVLTADCVPILLYDDKNSAIGVVHAGWKGTKGNIVSKTVRSMMQEYDTIPSDLIASIGPAIGSCCYEVGYDVAGNFNEYSESIKRDNKKFMLDLKHINRQQLLDAGLIANQIEVSKICTSCDSSNYFSYRAQNGCSGRFMSIIGLKD